MCGDDKNCQTTQSYHTWPVQPKVNRMWSIEPAVYSNTRKMQSDPKKRQQMQFNQMNDSSVEKVQSQCVQKKPKKMQPVVWPVKS